MEIIHLIKDLYLEYTKNSHNSKTERPKKTNKQSHWAKDKQRI